MRTSLPLLWTLFLALAAGAPARADWIAVDTAETFSVGDNGDARYAVPVAVPPGPGNTAPRLQMVYTSQRGDGRLGVGWDLQGLSAIGRCAAIPAVDGFRGTIEYNADDRFCIDGKRLIEVQAAAVDRGAVYDTELTTWSSVTASVETCGSGPCSFTVQEPDGALSYYGTDGSAVLAVGKDDVRVWPLQRHVDAYGNVVVFTYTATPFAGASAEDGQYYVSEIAYAGHRDDSGIEANRFVRFVYQARPEVAGSSSVNWLSQYVGGSRVITRAVLSSVRTYVGATEVEEYRLEYDVDQDNSQVLLRSVQECAGTSSSSPCLPAGAFLWQSPAPPTFGGATDLGPSVSNAYDQILPMDVNGDARGDVVVVARDAAEARLIVTTFLSNGSTLSQCPSTASLPLQSQGQSLQPVEFDEDGRTDLLYLYTDTSSQLAYRVYLGSSCGFAADPVSGSLIQSDSISHLWAMDANGDGLTDLVFAYLDPTAGNYETYLSLAGEDRYREPSSSFDEIFPKADEELWPADVNGDGMVDLVQVWYDNTSASLFARTYLATGTTFTSGTKTTLTSGASDARGLWPLDVNGDGRGDLARVWQRDNVVQLTAYLADGAGGYVCDQPDAGGTVISGCTIDTGQVYDQNDAYWPMDVNGDSRVDFVQAQYDGTLRVYANQANGFDQGTRAGRIDPSRLGDTWPLDVGGDGKADLLQVVPGTAGGSVAFDGYFSTGPVPGLVATFVNPIGGQATVTYKPMSDPSVYTEGPSVDTEGDPQYAALAPLRTYPYRMAPAQSPYHAVGGGTMQLVAQTVRANDAARNASTYSYTDTYTYSGGLLDIVGGRGWAGFRQIVELDEASGLRTTTTYNQTFPLTGTTADVLHQCVAGKSPDPRCTSTSALTSSVSLYHVDQVAQGASPGQAVLQVLLRDITFLTFDYGTFDFARRKTFEYDQWGNAVLVSDFGHVDQAGNDVTSADDVYTCNDYVATVTGVSWAVADTKVSSAKDCADFQSFDRATDYSLQHSTYFPEGGVETSSIYDDVNDVDLVQSYTYDVFGNTRTTTSPGGATTTYRYESAYNTYLESAVSPPNQNGTQLEQIFGFDPRFGVQVATSQPFGHGQQPPDLPIQVTCLDPFGRSQAIQGPIPQAPAGVAGDPNCLPAATTGDAPAFRAAAVVTLTNVTRQRDSENRIFQQTDNLAAWTFADSSPAWQWSRAYVDGEGRGYLATGEGPSATQIEAGCTNFDAQDKPVRMSVVAFYADAGALDCSSSSGSPSALWATVTYDAYGRPTAYVEPAGPDGTSTTTTALSYDRGLHVDLTRAARTPEALLKKLRYGYFDSQRKIVEMVVPDDSDATTTYDYDRIGRLVSVSDPKDVVNTITYDSVSRRLTVDNPDQNTTGEPGVVALAMTYDASTGYLRTSTDAKGQTTSFGYDELGRLTQKDLASGERINYSYDDPATPNGWGQQTGLVATLPAGQTELYRYAFAYDRYGQKNATVLTLDGAGYSTTQVFDPQSRILTLTYPDDAEIGYTYLKGYLQDISSDVDVYARYSQYSPFGDPGRVDYGNGVRTEYSYSPTGQMNRQSVRQATGTGETLLDVTYGWNHLNQVTSLTDDARVGGADDSQVFRYRLTRLVQATATSLYGSPSFGYDTAGNLTSKDGYTYTYEAHRVVSGTGDGLPDLVATYDDNGNMRQKDVGGDVRTYTYDVRNRLTRVARNNEIALWVPLYDDAGSRLVKITPDLVKTLYVSPVYQLTLFPDGSRRATRYVAGPGGTVATVTLDKVDGAGTESPGAPTAGTLYFHKDHLGSTSLTTDAGGAVSTRLVYLPYGGIYERDRTGPDNFRPKFQGQELDATAALYYFNARYYDPSLGRFLSADTQLGSHLTEIDSLNRFAFALNNPSTYVDPSGHGVLASLGGFMVGVVEVTAGAAIDVLSDGALAPIGGMLIDAGINGATYSLTHSSNFSWSQYAMTEAVGAAIGLVTDGIGSVAEMGVSAMATESAELVTDALVDAEAEGMAMESSGALLESAPDSELGAAVDGGASGADVLGGDRDVCPAASFPRGVLVATEDGDLPIEDVEVGDHVWGLDQESGALRLFPVTKLYSRSTAELVYVTVDDEVIVTTPEHPFYVDGEGWVDAGHLEPGNVLVTMDLDTLDIGAVGATADVATQVFNFSVLDAETYFVSDERILVHNCRGLQLLGYAPAETTSFSGVYDQTTDEWLAFPSGQTTFADNLVPGDRVPRNGGHGQVEMRLRGGPGTQTFGFTLHYRSQGQLDIEFVSGINARNYQTRDLYTDADFRQWLHTDQGQGFFRSIENLTGGRVYISAMDWF